MPRISLLAYSPTENQRYFHLWHLVKICADKHTVVDSESMNSMRNFCTDMIRLKSRSFCILEHITSKKLQNRSRLFCMQWLFFPYLVLADNNRIKTYKEDYQCSANKTSGFGSVFLVCTRIITRKGLQALSNHILRQMSTTMRKSSTKYKQINELITLDKFIWVDPKISPSAIFPDERVCLAFHLPEENLYQLSYHSPQQFLVWILHIVLKLMSRFLPY